MFKRGLLSSFPIVMGYIPVAVTFGIYASAAGLSKLETLLASILIYAGASQFALISFLPNSLWVSVATPILLNLRHFVYGCVVYQRFSIRFPFITAFGLTDEVFAVSLSAPNSESFLWGLEVGAYSSWILGTLIGVFSGAFLLSKEFLAESLLFSLSALFFTLLIPRLEAGQRLSVFIGGAIALAFHFLGQTPLGVFLAGALTPLLVMRFRRGENADE